MSRTLMVAVLTLNSFAKNAPARSGSRLYSGWRGNDFVTNNEYHRDDLTDD